MAEYIEREALLADIDACVRITSRPGKPSAELRGASKVISRIETIPAADVRTVVRGAVVPGNNPFTGICSECGANLNVRWNYCPNCGARMDGDGDV